MFETFPLCIVRPSTMKVSIGHSDCIDTQEGGLHEHCIYSIAEQWRPVLFSSVGYLQTVGTAAAKLRSVATRRSTERVFQPTFDFTDSASSRYKLSIVIYSIIRPTTSLP